MGLRAEQVCSHLTQKSIQIWRIWRIQPLIWDTFLKGDFINASKTKGVKICQKTSGPGIMPETSRERGFVDVVIQSS